MADVPIIPDDTLRSATLAFLDVHAERQPKGEFCTCNACHLGRAYLRMLPVVEAAVRLARADAECSAAVNAIGTENDDVTRPFQARIEHDHAVEAVCSAVRAMKEQTR